MGFALSQTLLHWSFDCAEGSIPFTRSTSPPFSLNGFTALMEEWDSVSHKEFNGLHLIFVLIPQNIVFLWALRSSLI